MTNPSQAIANPAASASSAGVSSQRAPALQVRVQKRYRGADSFVLNVDFIAASGFTILFGASGAGKTTLLDCVAGLCTPEAGVISVAQHTLFDAAARLNLGVAERKVGYLFQDLALFPHLSVEGNVAFGLSRLSAADREQKVTSILEALHIHDLRKKRPREISGGQRQRVALARSLVTDPCVLLLDEPLAALDTPAKGRILDDLRIWNEAHRVPILYVTHSREEVFALGERVVVLEAGRILAEGSPHDVMNAPRQETVAQLAGFENVFDAEVDSTHEDRGTMTCRLVPGDVLLETPLVRAEIGARLRVGIRAGDILLATTRPEGLSARNLLAGKMLSLARRDVIVVARVDVGAEMEVHLTLAARDALQLAPGKPVWLIVKTHSCHLMAK